MPTWETALRKIDPAKADASYAVGEQIVRYRYIALMQVGYVRRTVAKERIKHTVSGELNLLDFVRGVFDANEAVVSLEATSQLTLSNLESFAPVIVGIWPDPADNEANTKWVRDYYAAIHPHSGSAGGYVNFMSGDDAHRSGEVLDRHGSRAGGKLGAEDFRGLGSRRDRQGGNQERQTER